MKSQEEQIFLVSKLLLLNHLLNGFIFFYYSLYIYIYIYIYIYMKRDTGTNLKLSFFLYYIKTFVYHPQINNYF